MQRITWMLRFMLNMATLFLKWAITTYSLIFRVHWELWSAVYFREKQTITCNTVNCTGVVIQVNVLTRPYRESHVMWAPIVRDCKLMSHRRSPNYLGFSPRSKQAGDSHLHVALPCCITGLLPVGGQQEAAWILVPGMTQLERPAIN